MRVNTEELAGQAYELQHLAARTDCIRDSILHITFALSRESVGAAFRPALNRARMNVELCGEDLRKLSTALHQISDAYALVERRVTEETEYAAVHQEWIEPRVIRLPSLRVYTDAGASEQSDPNEHGTASAIDWTPWDPDPAI